MAKKAQPKEINTIPCKDCLNHYDPDYTNLSHDSKLPILCKCKFKQYMVFYKIVEKDCCLSKPIKK